MGGVAQLLFLAFHSLTQYSDTLVYRFALLRLYTAFYLQCEGRVKEAKNSRSPKRGMSRERDLASLISLLKAVTLYRQRHHVIDFSKPLCFQFAGKMAPTIIYLPNGQTLTVSPVFAGLAFRANDLNVHHSVFPPGWTILIESEDELDPELGPENEAEPDVPPKQSQVHRYRSPTLHSDNLFISSISNPSNIDFKPATSPTRQIAMMLWATLYWYFHQVRSCEYWGKPLTNLKCSLLPILIFQQALAQILQRLAVRKANGA